MKEVREIDGIRILPAYGAFLRRKWLSYLSTAQGQATAADEPVEEAWLENWMHEGFGSLSDIIDLSPFDSIENISM